MATKNTTQSADDSTRKKFTAPEHLVSHKTKRRLIRGVQIGIIVLLLLYVVFPVYWSVSSAFKTPAELFKKVPPLIPYDPTLANFKQLLLETEFTTYFINSIIVGVGATIISTVLATLGGYGLTRANFRGQRPIARSVLFAYMFPPMLLAIPLYTIFYNLGLLNSYFALMLAHTSLSLPFSLWMMWQYFQTVPQSYEESAWLNGASRMRTLWDVILPIARPGIIAISIFSFAISWNDFTMAVVIMTDNSMLTFPVGINGFIEQTAIHWGLIQTAGTLVMLPAFLLVYFLQEYILYGFSVGNLK